MRKLKKGNVSFPLYLNKESLDKQVETIGLAFNRYNTQFLCKKKTFRCFCLALDKTRIVSIGVNRSKTHPRFKDYADNEMMSIHAEIDMIINIHDSKEFNNVTDIYIVRGHFQSLPLHPCPLCLSYLTDRFKSNTKIHYYEADKWICKILAEFD